MCLSNCSECKYFDHKPYHSGDIVCGLNPAYATAWNRLKPLDEYTLSCLPIDECREFELNPALEEKAIALSLNFFDWQRLERETSNPAIGKALKAREIEISLALTVEKWQQIANNTSIPALRVALAEEGIEAKRDPWICVDSSCIDAIAYLRSESTLKVRFNRGAVYEYYQVEECVFFDLCDADSHGEYLNQHIKGCYNYRLL